MKKGECDEKKNSSLEKNDKEFIYYRLFLAHFPTDNRQKSN